jgi:hypothetical protein
MPSFFPLIAGSLVCLGLLFASVPLKAAHEHGPEQKRRIHSPRDVPSCLGVGTDAFVGGGNGNQADATNSAVLGGEGNDACGRDSGVGSGYLNGVSGIHTFIAGGYLNGSTGNESFVGAGVANAANANGAFAGAGGEAYYLAQADNPQGSGNVAGGLDSFVGAGDLNQVTGQGSFVGAGGSSYAQTGANAVANGISGVDSFIGAGDQNYVGASWGFVGGGQLNSVNGPGSFIGAGGYIDSTTTKVGSLISGTDSFIGAGDTNKIDPNDAFIGGGMLNAIANSRPGAGSRYAAIAGGLGNTISAAVDNGAEYGAIAGGIHNSLSGIAATIGGGYANVSSGEFATVPGGERDLAAGIGSFAAGVNAQAIGAGTFAWSDGDGSLALKASKPYQFVARASGGYVLYSNAGQTAGVQLTAGSGTWGSLSDRSMKTDVVTLDDNSVLAKVAALPVSEWSYLSEHGVRHVGPMAQDFYAAFHVGADDRHITSIDEDGVALAAIKALHAENRNLQAQNRSLREHVARDDTRLDVLERKVAAMAER